MHLADFTTDSPYPSMRLVHDETRHELAVEGYGPITVGRIRELDQVGKVQWASEELRKFTYSLEAPQPASQPVQQPVQQPQAPSGSSSSSAVTGIVAIVALLVVVALGYFAFTALSDNSNDPETPPIEQSQPPASEETTG